MKFIDPNEVDKILETIPEWVLVIQNQMKIDELVKKICLDFDLSNPQYDKILYTVNMLILGVLNGNDFLEAIKEILPNRNDNEITDFIEAITSDVLTPLRQKIKQESVNFQPKNEVKKSDNIEYGSYNSSIETNEVQENQKNFEYGVLKKAGVEVNEKTNARIDVQDKNIDQNTSQEKDLQKLTIPKKPKK